MTKLNALIASRAAENKAIITKCAKCGVPNYEHRNRAAGDVVEPHLARKLVKRSDKVMWRLHNLEWNT